MNFYFTVHLLLGIFAASIANLSGQSSLDAPAWISSPIGKLTLNLSGLGCLAAIITTIVNYSFIWGLATVAEIALGAVISGFLPKPIRAIAALGALIGVPVILGALWGFWYI